MLTYYGNSFHYKNFIKAKKFTLSNPQSPISQNREQTLETLQKVPNNLIGALLSQSKSPFNKEILLDIEKDKKLLLDFNDSVYNLKLDKIKKEEALKISMIEKKIETLKNEIKSINNGSMRKDINASSELVKSIIE